MTFSEDTDNEEIVPIPELPITLEGVDYLAQLVIGDYNALPNEYSKELAKGLLALWQYWSKKTRDPSRFMLHIRR
jgi:hypothetical protein